jgi:hypothetical protein
MVGTQQQEKRFRGLWLLSGAATILFSCGCNQLGTRTDGELSQKTAALVMLGTVASDAQLALSLRGRFGKDTASVTPDSDLDLYVRVANVRASTAQQLRRAFQDLSVSRLELMTQIESESLAADSMGPAFIRIGLGLAMVSRLFPALLSSGPFETGTADTAKKMMGVPVTKEMFESGRLVKLPPAFKATLLRIEGADLSSSSGVWQCLEDTNKLMRAFRLIVVEGEVALSRALQ